MADGVRAADANNAIGRWTGQDSATPLGGLRACVRACVKGWRRSPCGCAQLLLQLPGLGRRSIRPSHVWIGEGRLYGRERRIGGEEGRLHRLWYIAAGLPHALSPIERAGAFLVSSPCVLLLLLLWKGKTRRKQASKQAFTTNAGKPHHNTTQARLLYQSLPLIFCAHWPAAHCELIGKRRRPTLASMLQRGARS